MQLLQLKVAGEGGRVDMSLSLLSTFYFVLNFALNNAKVIKLLTSTRFKSNFKVRFFRKAYPQRMQPSCTALQLLPAPEAILK